MTVNIFIVIFFQHITENYYSNSKYLIDMDKVYLNALTLSDKNRRLLQEMIIINIFLSCSLTTFS